MNHEYSYKLVPSRYVPDLDSYELVSTRHMSEPEPGNEANILPLALHNHWTGLLDWTTGLLD